MHYFDSHFWAEWFASFDIWQVLSSFVFLFAIIDPFGNIPITLNMKKRGIKIHADRVCIASFVILMVFLILGEWVLKLFGVQIEYFAIAGGFVIFLMALEMILDVVIFQNNDLEGEGSIVLRWFLLTFSGQPEEKITEICTKKEPASNPNRKCLQA